MKKRLWDTGDELRANSKLKSSESSVPMPGLTFLRCLDQGRDRSRQFTIQDLNLLPLLLERDARFKAFTQC
ncbi:MAG: hypothetical protein A3G40_07060 [Deltaproteobacteria bacterium RIFCSPLOWO2_12_FULL_57_22]|nr:MAG: hypothetical protein A3G40_07060 [Deltaproteobacteria bacterium RIFCSPLOWO2_12_FULL_57_22]